MIQGVKFIIVALLIYSYGYLGSYDVEYTVIDENRNVGYKNINKVFTQNTLFLNPLSRLSNYLGMVWK